ALADRHATVLLLDEPSSAMDPLSKQMVYLGTTVLLLDEPSSAMDLLSKQALWKLLRERRADTALLLSTHSMAEAEALSTTIGIMGKGEMRCLGAAQELKSRFGDCIYVQLHQAQLE
ncbi:hypothetical protein T484DRAFT_1768475, partial [Baffinella frigidus]